MKRSNCEKCLQQDVQGGVCFTHVSERKKYSFEGSLELAVEGVVCIAHCVETNGNVAAPRDARNMHQLVSVFHTAKSA